MRTHKGVRKTPKGGMKPLRSSWRGKADREVWRVPVDVREWLLEMIEALGEETGLTRMEVIRRAVISATPQRLRRVSSSEDPRYETEWRKKQKKKKEEE